ncbi:hypothetical protein BD779DRAFT_512986 [Infundibulicybe gibba]|nr:hypothetical protein BD779DRAFT_512986 [Infundibulicybe gibba]
MSQPNSIVNPEPLFLGFDLSTQQLKALLLTPAHTIAHECAVHFDRDLPHYGTTGGAHHGPVPHEVTSPVAMWLEALDRVVQMVSDAGVSVRDIKAVGGAAQQHGSVYWSTAAPGLLRISTLPARFSTAGPAAFSTPRAPIWQDASTTAECTELEEAAGGAQALADLTGSRAYERFTGPQIARLRKTQPAVYAATAHISLVSSFLASLFLGAIAPIEVSDASGMNLMDVLTGTWSPRLLELCGGPELRTKLGPEPVSGGTVLGRISSWWVQRWGFDPSCVVAPFTGDNPATSAALSGPGDALLSLGTSTTLLLSLPPAPTPPARPTTAHLLAHPAARGASIAMLCYKNGALARAHVAQEDWGKFSAEARAAAPGCAGHMGLWFPLREIIPPGVVGEFFFTHGEGGVKKAEGIPQELRARAILESQFLSVKARVADIIPAGAEKLRRLVITGGASGNEVIQGIAADVFGMDVYVCTTKEAAGLGGALLARYTWWHSQHPGASFEDMLKEAAAVEMRCVARPREEARGVYDGLVDVYRACEADVVAACAAV